MNIFRNDDNIGVLESSCFSELKSCFRVLHRLYLSLFKRKMVIKRICLRSEGTGGRAYDCTAEWIDHSRTFLSSRLLLKRASPLEKGGSAFQEQPGRKGSCRCHTPAIPPSVPPFEKGGYFFVFYTVFTYSSRVDPQRGGEENRNMLLPIAEGARAGIRSKAKAPPFKWR